MNLDKIKKLCMVLLGNWIYAVGIVYFILPAGLITGGTTGIALVVNHYTGFSLNLFVTLFNVTMFVVGAVVLGKQFAMTTLVSTFAYPMFLELMEWVVSLTGCPTSNEMLCTIFGGCLVGIGIAVVIQAGASTGGMDIPPLIVNKFTGISVAVMLYVFDFVILIMQMIFTEGEKVLYGILLVCMYSIILEKFLVMGKSKVQIKVVSKYYEEINDTILHQFDRGTTLFEVEGGYTRSETYAILSVISNRELFPISEKIKQIDPEAFIIIEQVKEVRGLGFTMRKRYGADKP